jgi:hypothetical protein
MTRFALAAGFALVAFAGTAGAQNPGVYTPDPPDLTGRWSGYWVSDTNGHTGPLRAKFRHADPDTYRVAFHGRFWVVVPFWYTTKLQVVGAGDGVVWLAGSQRLGPGLGAFSTTAAATATDFDATFSSRGDSGRFVMSRRR